MRLKKKLGQNFLKDGNILRKEVAIADVSGKIVLEIGPGDGRLTREILDAGARKVYAVEKDTAWVSELQTRFFGEKRLELVNADFLEYEIPEDVEVVIGNIPYYISAPIIFKLKDSKVEKIVLMVQKEFGQKMAANPRDSNYGRLSVTSQIFFKVELVQKVPKHLFTPAPKVDSVVVLLKPTGVNLSSAQEGMINRMFQQKNKKLRNVVPEIGEKWAQKRARELSPEEVLEIISRT
ncbi:MAG: 16S rRNA (adenine(1518)-N(6)/adenine(1519)-N(6))-dimethyltransferase RsmA [Candidatus Bilamarchaeaceae archaeon]